MLEVEDSRVEKAVDLKRAKDEQLVVQGLLGVWPEFQRCGETRITKKGPCV